MNAKHSSGNQEWYSPAEVVELARSLMGRIGLDPASCSEANKTVKAERFFCKEDNGLEQDWVANTVFLNPPGEERVVVDGKKVLVPETAKYPKKFWQKLVKEWQAGRVRQAVFVCFSIEQLQTFQGEGMSPLRFPFCIPKKRMKFTGAGNSPTHGNALVWLPPMDYGVMRLAQFIMLCEDFGEVVVPWSWPMAGINNNA